MTQPPPDQQPTQHAPQQRPSLEKGPTGPQQPGPQQPGPQQPGPQQPGPQQPGPQQWPVAPPPNPYGGGGGYPPYGGSGGQGSGYGPGYGPGGPVPPPSGSSGKAIAIIIGAIVLVVLLFCGGIIAAIAVIANNVEDAFDDFDPDRLGGRDNPISVSVGESFEIDGVEYAEGWQVQQPTEEYDGTTIVGLEGTNDRADETSEFVYLTFTFVDGRDVEIGQVTCSSSGDITYGNTEVLSCRGFDRIDGAYDHVEVSAS